MAATPPPPEHTPAPAPLSTDEPFDRVFSRPVAEGIVRLAAPTPITPNQITGIAALFGVAVGVAIACHVSWLGAACLLGYLAFDCADGQLARLRGGGGYLGRAMDGAGDYIAAVAIHIGLALWIGDRHGSWVAGWLLSAGAGGALIWASFLLDRYKRRYRGDVDDLDALRAEAARTPGIGGWLIARLEPYAEKLEAGVRVPDRPAYQARVRLPMRLWLWNGPSMHFCVMAVCFVFDRPGLYALIAMGPMVLMTLLALWLQLRAERRAPAVVTRA